MSLASVARLSELDRLLRFPILGILLARLAVDARVRGQGLSGYLLEEALGLKLQKRSQSAGTDCDACTKFGVGC